MSGQPATRPQINSINDALGPEGVELVESAFFNADIVTQSHIFFYYGVLYGDGPKQYARDAYWGWKTGTIRPSYTTRMRILEIAPYFLSRADKAKITRAAFAYHFGRLPKRCEYIELNPYADLEKQFGRIRQFLLTDRLSEIPASAYTMPSEAQKYVTWFLADEISALSNIAAAYVREQQKVLCSGALVDLANFKTIVKDTVRNSEFSISHIFHLLTVDLEVNIKKEVAWYWKLPWWVYAAVIIFIWFKLAD